SLGARVRELGATTESRRMALERCVEVVVAHTDGRIEIQTAIPLTAAPGVEPATAVRNTLVLPNGRRRYDRSARAVTGPMQPDALRPEGQVGPGPAFPLPGGRLLRGGPTAAECPGGAAGVGGPADPSTELVREPNSAEADLTAPRAAD